MDAGVESPLDVLSRAATMIQETQQQEDAAAAAKSSKQLPTTKWKRDRRTRPDYLRKSDPKYPPEGSDLNGTNGNSTGKSSSSSASSSPVSSTGSVTNNKTKKTNGHCEKLTEAPLDMTTTQRQRGLPPSYSQAISDPNFRSTYTTSNRVTAIGRDEIPTGISMCDPIIDEHFRRSLGKDYNAVFNNNAKENPIKSTKTPIVSVQVAPSIPPTIAEKETPTTPVTSVIEMMDTTGLSVDDHFAKALGDTWHKLNKKDSKNNETTNNVNTAVTSPTEVVST